MDEILDLIESVSGGGGGGGAVPTYSFKTNMSTSNSKYKKSLFSQYPDAHSQRRNSQRCFTKFISLIYSTWGQKAYFWIKNS